MRIFNLLLVTLLVVGCATGKPSEDDYVTRVGTIAGKDVIEPEGGSDRRQVNTTGSVSISSGSGVSVGVGVLLGSRSRGSARPSVRYRVDLLDGEQITVLHENDAFEVGDCVEIRSLPEDDSQPPLIKRVQDACPE